MQSVDRFYRSRINESTCCHLASKIAIAQLAQRVPTGRSESVFLAKSERRYSAYVSVYL